MKRISNSFKGILGGIIAIAIGIGLLWWNEGNNVKNLKTTAELDEVYIDVDSSSIDSKNEGKLIATSGKLINEETLTDKQFLVSVETPLMKRIVEVYQWEEDEDTDEDGDTVYRYKKVWSSELIDSTEFNRSGYNNPQHKKFEDETFASKEVKVGAFKLSDDQIKELSTNAKFTDFNEEQANKNNLTISGKYLTNSEDLDNPKIGDVRIYFVYNNSTDISVLAVQKGESFIDFVSKAGKNVNKVVDGTHSGKDMINDIKKSNNAFKWVLRVAGAILCMMGFSTILKPISAITSYVPILGSLVGAAVGLVSFILGLCLSLLVIAIAWIRFRPIVGISLLAIIGVLLLILFIKNKKTIE